MSAPIVKAVNPGKNCFNCPNCENIIAPIDYACSYWSEFLPGPESTVCYLHDDSLNPKWGVLFNEINESVLITEKQNE